MNFKEALSHDSRRAMIETIANAIGSDKIYFKEVLEIAYTAKNMSSSRAARVIDLCVERNPEFGEEFADEIALKLMELADSRTKRSLCRILTRHLPNNEETLGHFMNFAFEQIASPKEPVALKVYAMQALFNISKQIPDIKNELIGIIEEEIPKNTAAFAGRGNMLLKKMNKARLKKQNRVK